MKLRRREYITAEQATTLNWIPWGKQIVPPEINNSTPFAIKFDSIPDEVKNNPIVKALIPAKVLENDYIVVRGYTDEKALRRDSFWQSVGQGDNIVAYALLTPEQEKEFFNEN